MLAEDFKYRHLVKPKLADFAVMAKAKKVIDADNDGWVFEGTPKKRRALPSEVVRGATPGIGLAGLPGGPKSKKPAYKKSKYVGFGFTAHYGRRDEEGFIPGEKPKPVKAVKKIQKAVAPAKKVTQAVTGDKGGEDKWKLPSGHVGAKVHIKDAETGEDREINVIGRDLADVHREVQSIKDEGHTISAVELPDKDDSNAPNVRPTQAVAPDRPNPEKPNFPDKPEAPETPKPKRAKLTDEERADIERQADEHFKKVGIKPDEKQRAEYVKRATANYRARQRRQEAKQQAQAQETPPEAPTVPETPEPAVPTPKKPEVPGERPTAPKAKPLSAKATPEQRLKAAQDHFDGGGGIADAPEGSDIVGAIRADKKRFDIVDTSGDLGEGFQHASKTFTVIDKTKDTGVEVKLGKGKKTTNEVFFIKQTSAGSKTKYIDDTINEEMSEELFNQMGWNVPKVSTSGQHHKKDAHTIQQHVLQGVGKDHDVIDVMTSKNAQIYEAIQGMTDEDDSAEWNDMMEKAGAGLVDDLKNSADPGEMLRMSMMDFVMLQQDRNLGNFIMSRDKKTGETHLVPIDNGFAFEGGIDTFWRRKENKDFIKEMQDNGATDDQIEELVSAPMDWEDWMYFRGANDNTPRMTATLGTLALGKDRAKVAAEIKKATQQMDAIDVDKVIARFEAQGMSEQQLELIRDNMEGMNQRIAWLKKNANKVAKELTP